ncbi:DNA-directed RNA polymerase I core subunit rpa12 [Pestalotiopsis sp. IQ-011]
MDPIRPNVGGSGGRPLRPVSSRRPGLAILTAAVGGIGVVFYAKNSSMRRNEVAQKREQGYYVSVDRSGGGV